MKDITTRKTVSVRTVRVRALELSVGFVVLDDELVFISRKAVNGENVQLTLIGDGGETFEKLTAHDTVFEAVVWPTRLANRCAPVRNAQIARDQEVR